MSYVPAHRPEETGKVRDLPALGQIISPTLTTPKEDHKPQDVALGELLTIGIYGLITLVICIAFVIAGLPLALTMILWGASGVVFYLVVRKQSLWHSSSGIAHHEIDSRERVARYVIDKHVELMVRSWEHESGAANQVLGAGSKTIEGRSSPTAEENQEKFSAR